jgi:hypothetical protein
MTDHPFSIRISGDEIDIASDRDVLFTRIKESEARARLADFCRLSEEQIDDLFNNYDPARFARAYQAIRERKKQ